MILLGAAGSANGPGPDSGPRDLVDRARGVLLSGIAITIPLIVTIIVLDFAVGFLLRTLSPVVNAVEQQLGMSQDTPTYVVQATAIGTLVAVTFLAGLVAETSVGSDLEDAFDATVARLPGIGPVYTSFNEMSDLLLSNDTESFREVKLVEFPVEGSYTLAFVTADTPASLNEAAGHDDMTTLFMPMAPNPVMGGFVMHISTERVYDVDLTVEEGIRSIVTSGVATGTAESHEYDGELIDIQRLREQAREGKQGLESWSLQTADDITALTVEEFAALKERTRAEVASVYPDADEQADHEGDEGEQANAAGDTCGTDGTGVPDGTDTAHRSDE